MILPKKEDAIHKAWLYRLLMTLADVPAISKAIHFKGGSCAAMLGFLDRFSVDLDFDLDHKTDKKKLRLKLHQAIKRIGLNVKDESKKALQFFLKYPVQKSKRNTIKLDIIDNTVKANQYEPQYFKDIDRYLSCQTLETMFSNKLVAVVERFEKRALRQTQGKIAGRDIYDTHYFFMQGYEYDGKIIKERTGLQTISYLKKLHQFISKKVTQTIIDQDLNTLLPYKKFNALRKILKQETLVFLKDEIGKKGWNLKS